MSTIPQGPWTELEYGNGKFVVFGSGINGTGESAYSTKGIDWTMSTIPVLIGFPSLKFADGKFLAINANGSSTGQSAYSTDGIDWVETSMPVGAWRSISYGNGKFIVTESGSRVAYSENGISNWNLTTLPSSEEWSASIHTSF
jgi:hypothetical protein